MSAALEKWSEANKERGEAINLLQGSLLKLNFF